MKTTINMIQLENGRAHYANGRTIASETGLALETKVEYIQRQSRWTGTGYINDIYRICGTDDALVIRHNDGPVDNIYWDNVRVEKGYFAKQRSYGAACREASRKYRLPMEVCLAIGPELCEEFAAEAKKVKHFKHPGRYNEPYQLDESSLWELSVGINRRKAAILRLLAECSEKLTAKVNSMGQKNSKRVARFFVAMADNN